MAVRLIEVRQPREHDLIGRRFVIAGYGTGFEATILWRVLDKQGRKLGEGLVQGGGSMGVIDDFGHEVTLGSASVRGAEVTVQVFGDDPTGENPPGPDLNQIRVRLFTKLAGWKLYEVRRGDTLTKIARNEGQNTTVDDVFNANRDKITDPDLIHPGQVFRIPLLD
jgi:nucleoid-associated protein YgaU